MQDNMKDNILNTGGDPPKTGGIDFSKMTDEELMKMDISDIFLEDLDRFLAEKEVRLSKRERMEALAEELNGSMNSESALDGDEPEAAKPAEVGVSVGTAVLQPHCRTSEDRLPAAPFRLYDTPCRQLCRQHLHRQPALS